VVKKENEELMLESQKVIQESQLGKQKREREHEGVPNDALMEKLAELEQQLLDINNNHEHVLKNLEQQNHEQMQSYEHELARVNALLEERQREMSTYEEQIHAISDMVRGKDDEIGTLRMLVEKQQSTITEEGSESPQVKSQLLTLKKEKEDLARKLKKLSDEFENYKFDVESRIEDNEMEIRKNRDEIKRYQYLVQEKSQKIEVLGQSQSIQ
jgi:chromosome segregation ATPase